MNRSIVTIKLVIFSTIDTQLKILFPKNALPSERASQKNSLDQDIQKLFENSLQMPLDKEYIEQLYTVSGIPNEIAIIYFALVPFAMLSHTFEWKTLQHIEKTNPDASVVAYALQRLQWKIEYTNVVYSLLPNEFTLSELQKTYEAILHKHLDKRNFRKKILSLHFLTPTEKKYAGNTRPAQMYMFTKRTPVFVNIF